MLKFFKLINFLILYFFLNSSLLNSSYFEFNPGNLNNTYQALHLKSEYLSTESKIKKLGISNNYTVAALDNNSIMVWDSISGLEKDFIGPKKDITAIAISSDLKKAFLGSFDSNIYLLDLEKLNGIKKFANHNSIVTSLQLTYDNHVLSGSWDQSVILWDLNGKLIKKFAHPSCVVSSISASKEKPLVLIASWDNKLYLWNYINDNYKILSGHTNVVTSCQITRDGKYGVSAGADNSVKYWDLNTGICLQTFYLHSDFITKISYSDEGYLLSSSKDNTLRFTNLRNGLSVVVDHLNSDVNTLKLLPTYQAIVAQDDYTTYSYDLNLAKSILK